MVVGIFAISNLQEIYSINENLCETNDLFHFNQKIDKKFLNLDEIEKRVNAGDDIIGRDDKFIVNDIDESFPKFILENKQDYKDWIKN